MRSEVLVDELIGLVWGGGGFYSMWMTIEEVIRPGPTQLFCNIRAYVARREGKGSERKGREGWREVI